MRFETVTIFGEPDSLELSLCEELREAGHATHLVRVPVGWVSTSTHPVVNAESPAGDAALRELATDPEGGPGVVVLCSADADELTRERALRSSRRCAKNRPVALLWHAGPRWMGELVRATHELEGALTSRADQMLELTVGPTTP